jgi:hypothetical protein
LVLRSPPAARSPPTAPLRTAGQRTYCLQLGRQRRSRPSRSGRACAPALLRAPDRPAENVFIFPQNFPCMFVPSLSWQTFDSYYRKAFKKAFAYREVVELSNVGARTDVKEAVRRADLPVQLGVRIDSVVVGIGVVLIPAWVADQELVVAHTQRATTER